MEKLTKQEIIEAFTKEGYDIYEINKNDGFEYIDTPVLKQVDQVGGEGEGDTYYTVIKVSYNGKEGYVRFNAYYDSWNGTDWSDFDIVQPKEVTVTRYYTVEE